MGSHGLIADTLPPRPLAADPEPLPPPDGRPLMPRKRPEPMRPGDRRWRFVRAYLTDPERNARRAAEAAGYKPDAGARLLRDPKVRQAIRQSEYQRAQRAEVKADRIVRQLMTIVEATVADFVWDEEAQQLRVRDGLPPDRIQAVASLKRLRGGGVQWRLWPKLEAIRLLGLHLGMFGAEQATQQPRVYMLPVVALTTADWQRAVAERRALAAGGGPVAAADDPSRLQRTPDDRAADLGAEAFFPPEAGGPTADDVPLAGEEVSPAADEP
jgi:hypothetical protein